MTSKPMRQYISKMFIIFPLTFLFPPLIYAFFGYHPEMTIFFPLFIYLWVALFTFLGATLALIFKKYKYLAYPIIIGIAFLCKNIISTPIFNFKQAVVLLSEAGEEILILIPAEIEQLVFYAVILFIFSSIAGCIGVWFSKLSAFDFTNKNNTLFFIMIYMISALFYTVSGIMGTDKNAGVIFVVYMACFVISYFMVFNYALIDREVSIYGEHGVYNTSGINRIYKYYFSLMGITTVIPIFIAIILVPFIVKIIDTVINFIIAFFIWLLTLQREPPDAPPEVELPSGSGDLYLPEQNFEMDIYYIFVIAFFVVIIISVIIFRKQIKEFFKFLFAKMNLFDQNNNKVINQEIITEAKKVKKIKYSYKDYQKRTKKITDLRERFLFAYNYIFWGAIKKDENLLESATPYEVAEIYDETKNPAQLYQDIKYGQKFDEITDTETLVNMLEQTENFIKNINI